jgi:Uma2 family endonuclease
VERIALMVSLMIPTPTNVPAIAGPPQGHWTPEDFERLPADGNRYELIDGVLYFYDIPSTFHQWIVMSVLDHLALRVSEDEHNYAVPGPVGLYFPDGTRLQPDFLLVLAKHKHIIYDGRVRAAPDIVIEVLSPGSDDYDQRIKKAAYERGGVPEYAVIDPGARALYHYRLESGVYGEPVIHGEGQTMTFAALPTIPLAISDLFAGSPDTTL